MKPLTLGVALALVLACQATAQPLSLQKIAIGKVSSDQDCKIYVLADSISKTYEESKKYADSDQYASQRVYAHQARYHEHIYKDCINNFSALKMSLEAAFASSGRFAVVSPRASRYSVSVRIGKIGTQENAMGDAGTRRQPGYENAQKYLIANMDFTISDGSHVVGGGELTKRLQIGSVEGFGNFAAASQTDGTAAYGSIQHEIAETVARAVAFKLFPLLVTSKNGNTIELNYGTPLLKTGTMIQVFGPSGIIHFNVEAAADGRAIARKDGSGDMSLLAPGTPATIIEPEDTAANARRIEGAELP